MTRSHAISTTLFAAMALFAAGAVQAATLNECKTSDGRTILLWDKCPEDAGAKPAEPKAAEPKAPEPKAPEPKAPELKVDPRFTAPKAAPSRTVPSSAAPSRPGARAAAAKAAAPQIEPAPALGLPQGAAPATGFDLTGPTAPRTAPGSPAPTAEEKEMERAMVVEITSGYTACAEEMPGFREQYAPSYEFWSLRNAAIIGRVRADPTAKREIDRRIAQSRGDKDPANQADKKAFCETLIGPFLAGRFAGPTTK